MVKKILLLMIGIMLRGWCIGQTTQLQFYVDNALRNSPLLRDFENQVEASRYDSLLIQAALKPQVTGNSFNSYAPVIKGFGYDNAITNGGNFSALVGVNKQLPNKKNLATQFESLRLLNQDRVNTARITEQDLKKNIIAQYITAYGSLQQLNFNRTIDTLLTREEAILKKLTRSNVYKQSDYLAFLVTMQQQQLLIKQSAIQFKNDVALLNYLSGITDTAAVNLQNPGLELYQLPNTASSVFFKKFEIDSLKLVNSKALVDVNYRPKFNLFADGGFNSTLTYQPYKNFGTSFGISATIPIYDGKQKKLQYSKIDIDERTRRNYRSFYITQYNQQVAQLMQQLTATEGLLMDINEQLKYTQSLIDVSGKLLEVGEARITDYVLALNNYINAKNLITQNTITRLQIINQINYWNR